MLAAGMMAASVNAQNTAITSNKFGDNWYVGINGGVATPMQKFGDKGFMKGFAPNAGIRIGKNLTTVFGLAAEGTAYLGASEKSMMKTRTFVSEVDVNLLGTFNLSNLFGTYTGEPRGFEVIALGGFGWQHGFGAYPVNLLGVDVPLNKVNGLSSKLALDFAFNLGADKAWQLYIEPAAIFALQSWANGAAAKDDMKYDSRAGMFQLNVGLNYKFGNSNGTHNFAKAQLRDQSEIDQLNGKINELRADNNAKDSKIAANNRTIDDFQAQLTACQNKHAHTAKVQDVEETNQL